ncbi:MAG: hypothetical protein QXR51_06270 [Desulfurococcaceae archaeon]
MQTCISKPSLSYKNRVELVFVSGPVGVGKTTISRNLLYSLSSRGYSVCYSSLVSFPLFSYLFFKLAAILAYGLEVVRVHEKVNIHPSTLFILRVRNLPRPIILMLVFLEALSIMLSFCVRILFNCMNKKVIIVDEGFVNMLASYFEIFGRNVFLESFTIALMKKLQRYFDLKIIYLDTNDEKILLKRWITRGYPAATSMIKINHHLRYTQLIRCSKDLISKNFQIIEIDNSRKPPYELVKEFVEGLFNVASGQCSNN